MQHSDICTLVWAEQCDRGWRRRIKVVRDAAVCGRSKRCRKPCDFHNDRRTPLDELPGACAAIPCRTQSVSNDNPRGFSGALQPTAYRLCSSSCTPELWFAQPRWSSTAGNQAGPRSATRFRDSSTAMILSLRCRSQSSGFRPTFHDVRDAVGDHWRTRWPVVLPAFVFLHRQRSHHHRIRERS